MFNVLAMNKEAEWAITCASHVLKWMPDYDNLMRYPEPISVLTDCTFNSLPEDREKIMGGGGGDGDRHYIFYGIRREGNFCS
jgi:hypothetical protein